jgi:hypothetical protein
MHRSALGTLCLCATAALVALVVAAPAAAMRPSHPDEVTDLPGLSFKPTFRHYSGYIPLPNSPKMFQSDTRTATVKQQRGALRYGVLQSSPFHLRLWFFSLLRCVLVATGLWRAVVRLRRIRSCSGSMEGQTNEAWRREGSDVCACVLVLTPFSSVPISLRFPRAVLAARPCWECSLRTGETDAAARGSRITHRDASMPFCSNSNRLLMPPRCFSVRSAPQPKIQSLLDPTGREDRGAEPAVLEPVRLDHLPGVSERGRLQLRHE